MIDTYTMDLPKAAKYDDYSHTDFLRATWYLIFLLRRAPGWGPDVAFAAKLSGRHGLYCPDCIEGH